MRLTEEQTLIRDTARAFAREQLGGPVRAAVEEGLNAIFLGAHHDHRVRTDLVDVVVADLLDVLLATSPLPGLRPQLLDLAIEERSRGVAREVDVLVAEKLRALLEQGRVADTIQQYRRAVEADPTFLTALNNLAWLLATLPDPALRNPEAALQLARRAADATQRQDPAVLDTLAAAHAAQGRSDRAAEIAERAAALAEAQGRPQLAAQLRGRAAIYRAGRAYREDPASGSAVRRATR